MESNFLLESFASHEVPHAPAKQRPWRVSESPRLWSRAGDRALCSDLALHLAAMENKDVISSHIQKWSISLSQLREGHSCDNEIKSALPSSICCCPLSHWVFKKKTPWLPWSAPLSVDLRKHFGRVFLFSGEVEKLMLKCQSKTPFTGKRKESCSLSFRIFFKFVHFFLFASLTETVAEQMPWCYMTSLHITYCTFDSMSNRLLPSAMLLLHSKLLFSLFILSYLSHISSLSCYICSVKSLKPLWFFPFPCLALGNQLSLCNRFSI